MSNQMVLQLKNKKVASVRVLQNDKNHISEQSCNLCDNAIKNQEKPVCRRVFAKNIHCKLVRPWLQRRVQVTNLSHPLCQSVVDILGVTVSTLQSNIIAVSYTHLDVYKRQG